MTEIDGFAAGLDDSRWATLLDPGPPPRDVPPGRPFSPWRLRRLSFDEFARLGETPGRLSNLQLVYLCWLNSLAPSSHNTNPQRFRLQPDAGGFDLWLDRRMILPGSDVVARQACVSLGCGLSNALLAARGYGWDATVEVCEVPDTALRPWDSSEQSVIEIARVRFTQRTSADNAGEPDWVSACIGRKIIRAEYDERLELESADLLELERIGTGFPGIGVHVIRDTPTLLFLAKFQELADTTVLNRDQYALELGEWLLEDHDDSPLGMRGAEFGLSPEMTRRFHQGLLRQIELLPDEIAGFAKASNTAIRSSSAIVVLTVETDTLARRLDAGRLYEELALRLWLRGWCTAMHAAITEVDAPNLALRGRLRTRWRPTVLFRIGRPLRESDWHRPHAARPLLSKLILT
jgi:hypothetical protein